MVAWTEATTTEAITAAGIMAAWNTTTTIITTTIITIITDDEARRRMVQKMAPRSGPFHFGRPPDRRMPGFIARPRTPRTRTCPKTSR
jgi:hypothetical protein